MSPVSTTLLHLESYSVPNWETENVEVGSRKITELKVEVVHPGGPEVRREVVTSVEHGTSVSGDVGEEGVL